MPDPIVFVPGLLCTAELYAPQLGAFEGKVECLIGDHTRHDRVDEIAADILKSAPDRFSLAGLSLGGYIALEMVVLEPERVGGLVLMDTNARADTPERTASRRDLALMARADGIDPVIDKLLPMFIDESRLDDAELIATIRKMARDTGFEVFLRQQEAIIHRKDLRPRLLDIACPTLVVCGQNDRLTPVEMSEEIASAIPGARLEIVGGSGHLTTLEKPDAVNAVLAEFFGT